MDIYTQAFCNSEEIRYQAYCTATYFCEAGSQDNIYARAAALAVGQTIGTWTDVPGVDAELLNHHSGRVTGVYPVPPADLYDGLPHDKVHFIAKIAFPESNFGDQLPMLLTALLGNDISTGLPVKLLDIEISRSLSESLKGPRFGIAGIRQRTGVYDRPLLLNVLKPCTGFPPESAVERFRDAARAGADIIKDDELLSDVSFNRLEKRAELFNLALRQVAEESGRRALYCANITDRADRMLVLARRAVELGCDMIMVNAPLVGVGMLQSLAEDPSVDVPILAHFAGFNAFTEAPQAGMTLPLFLGKVMRLAGADAIILPSPYSAYPLKLETFQAATRAMRLPIYDLPPALPVPGGGIHPATAYQITRDLGLDVMLDVGGGIQGHPGGAQAGGKAMLAAIDAAVHNQDLKDKAAQVPELAQALAKW